MSWMQFAEWVVYISAEPLPASRADFSAGQIVAMVHNVNAKRADRKKVSDFIPKYDVVKAHRRNSRPLTSKDEWKRVMSQAKAMAQKTGRRGGVRRGKKVQEQQEQEP